MNVEDAKRNLDELLTVSDEQVAEAVQSLGSFPATLSDGLRRVLVRHQSGIFPQLESLLESASAGGGIPGPTEATMETREPVSVEGIMINGQIYLTLEQAALLNSGPNPSIPEAIRKVRGGDPPTARVAFASGPSREWLEKAGDIEDAARSVSVGGLAADLGMLAPSAVRRRVVCLCGSTRFWHEYQLANYRETMAGRVVLTVGHYPHAPGQAHGENVGCTPEQKLELDELHLRKIDMADEILVIDVNGYAGESTKREIAYAKSLGKPVRFISEEWPKAEFWTMDDPPPEEDHGPLSDPSVDEVSRALERYSSWSDGSRASIRHALTEFVRDRRGRVEVEPKHGSDPTGRLDALEAAVARLKAANQKIADQLPFMTRHAYELAEDASRIRVSFLDLDPPPVGQVEGKP